MCNGVCECPVGPVSAQFSNLESPLPCVFFSLRIGLGSGPEPGDMGSESGDWDHGHYGVKDTGAWG